jgi:hypothetical protein
MATHQRPVHRGRHGTVSAHEPDWSNWNYHDPGVTLVALFGFLGAALLWQSSGRREGAASTLPRVLGVGLGAARAMFLLRQRYRRKPPL